MNFEMLLKERHSAVNYIEDFKMTEDDFKKIFELTKLAPSTYNLQSANYLVIMDPDKKNKVYDICYRQHKIKTASAVVLVLGNKDSFSVKSAENIYGPMKMLRIISEDDYNAIMGQIENFLGGLNKDPNEVDKELQKICSINATFFMLAAKYYGFDTCPMHAHGIPQLREEFNIPSNQEIMMMITIGKSVDKIRPRGYRRPTSEVVTYNTFK